MCGTLRALAVGLSLVEDVLPRSPFKIQPLTPLSPLTQQVCVAAGAFQGSPPCTKYYVPAGQDTCDSIRRKNFISATEFSNLNPGLDCNKLFPTLQRSDGGASPRIGTQVRSFARHNDVDIHFLVPFSWH